MPRFDLEQAIRTWRLHLRKARVFLHTDLEELEAHLRDHVEALVQAGLSEGAAFRRATSQLGFPHELQEEYRKVRFGRTKRTRHVLNQLIWEIYMLKSYAKIAWRNVRRRPGFTFINVTGLAIGAACCLLLLLYVQHELSYDAFHTKADRIVRVDLHLELNGVVYDEASVPFPAAEALRRDYPEVEQAVRLFKAGALLLNYQDQQYKEENVLFVDSTFFEVFDFPLLQGVQETALSDPNGVVLTESTATKYFGRADPIGRTLELDSDGGTMVVTGVVHDVPENAHFTFDLLVPLRRQLDAWRSVSGDQGRENKWFWTGAWTYLLLRDAGSVAALQAKLPDFVGRYFPDLYQPTSVLTLRPIRDIHLYSNAGNELKPPGDILFIYIFGAIAVLVLVIACINFANLTTAQVMERTREVGVRKSLGADQTQVRAQLLGEGLLLSLLAIVLAVGLAYLLLPAFGDLTGVALSFGFLGSWAGVGTLILLAVGVGLLPGLYPAFYLARLNPVSILRGTVSQGPRRNRFRNGLVVLQFAASIALLISVGIIYQQVRYFQQQDLGFEEDHVVVVKPYFSVSRQFDTFREALLANPAIRNVATSSYVPGQGADGYRFFPEGHPTEEPLMLPLNFVNYDFPDVLGVTMKQGRWFSEDFPTDAAEAFVVNEQAAATLGWGDEAVGKQLQLLAPGTTDIYKTGKIIGVINDYHFESLHHPVRPLVMSFVPTSGHYLLKVNGGQTASALAHLEATWEMLSPEWPIEHYFLDENLATLYEQEHRMGRVVGYLTVLAVLIAALGLVGLSSFTAVRRRKEICIRKVHGASVPGLLGTLSKGYFKLLLISFVLAAPIAYFGMKQWLQNFAYHTTIGAEVFLGAGLLAALVAVLAVGYQSLRVAHSNPAEVLRHE